MNKKIRESIIMAFLTILFLVIINKAVFPWIMGAIKIIFFIAAIICAWSAIGYFLRYLKAYNRKNKETVYNLIFRSGMKTRIVNLLTLYRIIISPFLLILVFNNNTSFKWFLLSAFITDALDGFLARRFKAVSKLGAKLDSLADDILFIVSLIAIIYLHSEVITENIFIITGMLFIFFMKLIFLWFKHKKIISGMHTYLTKAAAFLQAVFFLDCVFFNPSNILFYITVCSTILALTEEIIIILIVKDLGQNIKGLFFTRSNM